MQPKARLSKILTKLPNPGITGYFYRSIDYGALHSIEPLNALYALGPSKQGQRYTPIGGPPALYVADKAYTSFAEVTHAITSSVKQFDSTPPGPLVVFAVSVHLEHILDLTDNSTLKALGTTVAELQEPWADQMASGFAVPTHLLAIAAYKTNRFQGIKYHSKEHPGGIDLIIWTDKLKASSFIEVFDPTKKLAARIPEQQKKSARKSRH